MHHRDQSDKCPLCPLPDAVVNPTHRVHNGRYAGIRGPNKGPTVLDCPEACEGKVLHWFDRIAVPGVVGQVEHRFRDAVVTPSVNEHTDLPGEDILIADVH